jgi:peptidoglycan lytic transglycosylase
MPACERRYRPLDLIATLACAMLFGCVQIERAPESVPPPLPTLPTPPPTVPISPTPPSFNDTSMVTQQRGLISMYGDEFAGRKTASGEPFDPSALTMAHRTLPFGTRVRITNLENHRSVTVVVNDRGPFVSGRIADLSEAAARRIGMVADGVVEALLEILKPAKKAPDRSED